MKTQMILNVFLCAWERREEKETLGHESEKKREGGWVDGVFLFSTTLLCFLYLTVLLSRSLLFVGGWKAGERRVEDELLMRVISGRCGREGWLKAVPSWTSCVSDILSPWNGVCERDGASRGWEGSRWCGMCHWIAWKWLALNDLVSLPLLSRCLYVHNAKQQELFSSPFVRNVTLGGDCAMIWALRVCVFGGRFYSAWGVSQSVPTTAVAGRLTRYQLFQKPAVIFSFRTPFSHQRLSNLRRDTQAISLSLCSVYKPVTDWHRDKIWEDGQKQFSTRRAIVRRALNPNASWQAERELWILLCQWCCLYSIDCMWI